MILMMIRTFYTTKSQSEAVSTTVLPGDFSTAGNGLTWLHQLFACKTSDNFVTLPAKLWPHWRQILVTKRRNQDQAVTQTLRKHTYGKLGPW